MNCRDATTLVAFRCEWLDELVVMWRASFEGGVGVKDPHPFLQQQQYFLAEVLPKNTIRIAILGQALVGFVAASNESISQLYVRIGFQRQGIGTKMLDWAKAHSSGSLWLYTFARNLGACAFYERNSFVPVAHGFEPMWQLEDVKYQWCAGAQDAT
jgi:ribosomal protein S18 acetylase RimI-like enzyme